MNKIIKLSGITLLLCLLNFSSAFAQQTASSATKVEISDSELKSYADLIKALTEIQVETQEKIELMIAEEKMPMETYNRIEQAEVLKKQNKEVKDKFSTAELAKYEKLSKKALELRAESNNEIRDLFQNGNITPQKFQEINLALQEDMELQGRYKKLAN